MEAVSLFGVPFWRPPVFCPCVFMVILVFSFQFLVFSCLVLGGGGF